MAAPSASHTIARSVGIRENIVQRRIPTDSKTTSKVTNGNASRKCRSWIESFVQSTESLEAPGVFRQWSAISTLAAVMEQKVYVKSGGEHLHPNVDWALVVHTGVGKSRCVHAAKAY